MKKILSIFSSALLLSLAIFSTGCGEDDPIVNDLSPIVAVTAGPTPANVVAGAGTFVTVTVQATKGTQALKAVTVYEGSTKLSIDDFKVDGVLASGNPTLITSPTDAMEWEISVKVNAAAGEATYSVKVEDAGGLSDEASFNVTVETALSATIGDATINLWNQAGPAGRGAIDLDNGASTGTKTGDYLLAELRDMGIDSLAGSGDNWRRRIGGINGTEVKYAGNVGTGVDFSAVASKEAIAAIFTNATVLNTASTITTGNIAVWGNFKVSDKVNQGDVFAVYKSSTSTYYLVVVNSITETTALGDNEDKYNVTIKY